MENDYIHQLQEQLTIFKNQIENTTTVLDLDVIIREAMGKKSVVAEASSNLKSLPSEDKKALGKAINAFKKAIENVSETTRLKILSYKQNVSKNDSVSVDKTLPGEKPKIGHLHPTTTVIRKINAFFRYLGYSVYEGPEIETNEYNFEKLNLPKDHPARELADTLYISDPEVLLRTHTSSVETRAMTNEGVPLRIVVPGKVYRNENSNTTNNSMFYQYEGLVIDHGISMSDLKGTLNRFVRFLYGEDVKTRFRCKYYPQVEPGAGLDIQCTFCMGKGCSVCKYRGWIEVLGCGLVHPNVLIKCGIDPKEWSGFAFGMGLDRLVMLTYGINDIRKLYNGELMYEDLV